MARITINFLPDGGLAGHAVRDRRIFLRGGGGMYVTYEICARLCGRRSHRQEAQPKATCADLCNQVRRWNPNPAGNETINYQNNMARSEWPSAVGSSIAVEEAIDDHGLYHVCGLCFQRVSDTMAPASLG